MNAPDFTLDVPASFAASAGSGALVARTLMGRARSGGDWGGSVAHAIADKDWKAICGKKPGKTSAGWSESVAECVTCPRCAKLMRQNKHV